MKYKITPISVTKLNVENQMFSTIGHILWQQFSKPLILFSFEMDCLCKNIIWRRKKWFWVCVHIDEPPLILIHIDELQHHLLFLYKNPFFVHFLWIFVLDVYFGWVVYLRRYPHGTPYDVFNSHISLFKAEFNKMIFREFFFFWSTRTTKWYFFFSILS